MKTLKESLKQYLITESDSSEVGQVTKFGNKIIMHNPGMIWNNNMNGNGNWIYEMPYDIELPKARFYLFNDKYRDCPHIVTLTDISYLTTMLSNSRGMLDFDDYEAYSPEDVIMSSDSLIDLLNKMIKDGYIKDDEGDYETFNNLYDSEYFIKDAFDDPKYTEEYLAPDVYPDINEIFINGGAGDGLFDKSGKLYWASKALYDSLLDSGFGNILKANDKVNLNKLTIKDLEDAGFFKE